MTAPHITLRTPQAADADTLLAWEHLDGDRSVTIDDMHRFIAHSHALGTDGCVRYVVECDGTAVGTVDLTNPTADGCGAYVSIYISDGHQGQGIGTRALKALVDNAATLGLKRLGAIICNANIISQSLFTSAGFVPVDIYHDDTEATVWMLDIAMRHV